MVKIPLYDDSWKKTPCIPGTVKRQQWIKERGPIPQGMQLNHKCDNRNCKNLDHIFLGSQSDNMKDCSSKGRHPGTRVEFKEKLSLSKSRLTRQNVIDIRNTNDKTIQQWSKELGVSEDVIYRAKIGHTFTSLPGVKSGKRNKTVFTTHDGL